MADRTNKGVQKSPAKKLPLAVPVQVQCSGFRCLAYRDEKGTWVDYHSGEPLKGVVEIILDGPDEWSR